jgi:hypothetical protein
VNPKMAAMTAMTRNTSPFKHDLVRETNGSSDGPSNTVVPPMRTAIRSGSAHPGWMFAL